MEDNKWYEYCDIYDTSTGILWHYKYECHIAYFSDGKPTKACVLVYKWKN